MRNLELNHTFVKGQQRKFNSSMDPHCQFCGRGGTQVTEVGKGFLWTLDNGKCSKQHGPQVDLLGEAPTDIFLRK